MKKLEEIFKDIDFEEMKKIHTKKVVEYLYPFIQNAKDEGYKLKDIYQFIKTNGIDIKNNTFNIYLTKLNKINKENKTQRINIPNTNKEDKKMENLKKVAIINFKGGVGKSTIANLLDLPNKVVMNLDTQNAKNSNYSDTINYLELKEQYGVSVNESLEILKEEGKEWIVFDTPGSISEELLEIIDEIDYIIVPFTKGNRSKETTIDSIKSILEIIDNDKIKFALVFNMYQDEKNLEEELKPVESEVKKLLGDKYKCSAALKFSKAVSTMEKTKKSIDELDLTNRIAYKAFKKRVKKMNEILQKCLFEDN